MNDATVIIDLLLFFLFLFLEISKLSKPKISITDELGCQMSIDESPTEHHQQPQFTLPHFIPPSTNGLHFDITYRNNNV